MTTHRDTALGAALRELEAPEHRPEFHAELHRRLAAERPTRRLRQPRRPRVQWAGWPDATSSGWMLPDDFGALVRAFLAAESPEVQSVETADGRPAWPLEVKAEPSGVLPPELSGDTITIVVDKQTAVPVEVTETREGAFRSQIRIENISVNPEVAANTFRLEFPADAEPSPVDHGFERVELGAVAATVGYAPLVPEWVPDGYRLAEVAVSPGRGVSGGVEASNPPSTDVVSLSYRRGLDQFLVTTRLRTVAGWGPDDWTDPLATGEGYFDRPEQVRVRRGALSGVELNLLIVPRNVPHIWALTEQLVVTVSGDLTRAELLRVSESLEPLR